MSKRVITYFVGGVAGVLMLIFSGSCLAQSYEEIPEWAQQWINEACPRALGPALWRSCVDSNLEALTRPGFPDVNVLSPEQQRWLAQACPRALGPRLARSCFERNITAFTQPNFPDLGELSARNKQWINEACPRALGPALWRSCVERNIAGLKPKQEVPKNVPQQSKRESASSGFDNSQPSQSPHVFLAQRYLGALGYDPGPFDGEYGPRTRNAIKAFQRDHGMRSDGKVSLPLLSALEIAFRERNRGSGTPQTTKSQKAAIPRLSWPSWRSITSRRPIAQLGSPMNPSEVYETAKESVWVVVAGRHTLDFEELRKLSQGSAIAVSRRHLLTNCHVVQERPVIAIVQGENVRKATLISADPKTDRCVLATEPASLFPVKGIRLFLTLKVGERVYSVGAPSGLERTLGEGIISGLRPTNNRQLIQTTAPISPGSSGGGLFDSSGNLIGVTTFLLKEAQSINFAISAEDFWR